MPFPNPEDNERSSWKTPTQNQVWLNTGSPSEEDYETNSSTTLIKSCTIFTEYVKTV